jgi:hypothetical protein
MRGSEEVYVGNRIERAKEFIVQHPELRQFMHHSPHFADLKKSLEIHFGDQTIYPVRGGDVLGGEEELLLDSLIRGENEQEMDNRYRAVFLDLPLKLRYLIQEYKKR